MATNGHVTIQNLRSVASSNQREESILDPSMILPQFADSQEFARRVKPSNEVPFDEFTGMFCGVIRASLLSCKKQFSANLHRYSNADHLSSEELQDIVAQGMDVFREQYYDQQRSALEKTQYQVRKRSDSAVHLDPAVLVYGDPAVLVYS
ncbi:hypothetical protein RvY_18410 [Ramazzottius varieornatus]|uniref:Uncharacterized protein n=1 Tax=Ramazzottius varieornatus TaxID=947166 RepID=A0A1D1W786_RAMVA|nr:hypothetical protein RvY_18410 [Ramazzottius varieornatus]